jgi:hypothetical protein
MSYTLSVTLESDATFARGEGTGSEVDTEVEYDLATGLPFVRGRVLKGLLTEECANILFALGAGAAAGRLESAAGRLFGRAGSTMQDDGLLRIGTARLPAELIAAVRAQVDEKKLDPADVLASLTDVRRQTSVKDATVLEQLIYRLRQEIEKQDLDGEEVLALLTDSRRSSAWSNDEQIVKLAAAARSEIRVHRLGAAEVRDLLMDVRYSPMVDGNGVPEGGSLRSVRVVLRGVTFVASLHVPANDADALALLAACVKAVRRGGLGRNRGRGKLALALQQKGSDVTAQHFKAFENLVATDLAVKGGK